MEFTLKSEDILSHLVLGNDKIAMEVAATQEWTEDDKLVASLTVNGVTVPVEELDKLLNRMWELANKSAGVLEKENTVKEKAEELLQERANLIRETLEDLENKLQDINQLLPYNWEK